MQQQVVVMLDMQDRMNSKVHPQWRAQEFDWYRAIWVECAELLDHYGWKWWKKQTPDIDQVQLELVDIWHFGLSQLLLGDTDDGSDLAESIAGEISSGLSGAGASTQRDFRADLEVFALHTLSSHDFSVAKFAVLLAGVGLSFDELYERYIGKNVLNFFRQDHGYQDGTYHKVWGGREDNEYLVELVEDLNSSDPHFQDNLYAALAQRYETLVASPGSGEG